MPEQLQFGFHDDSYFGMYPRHIRKLVISTSMGLFNAAATQNEALTGMIDAYSGRDPTRYGYGILEILDEPIIEGGFSVAVRVQRLG